jgi:Amt family ammonium transporter
VLAALASYSAIRLRIRWQWDDALDVWACHGVGGALGTILTGVFASSAIQCVGGLIEGNFYQFAVQLLGAVVTMGFAFTMTWGTLKVINIFHSVRVPEEVELKGLDEGEFGEQAYVL